ncbi:MAG: hypothetical protein N2203_03845 [Bacteroidia bacterium]|nr:hypothetical protein [Bacteroidia bacterium]
MKWLFILISMLFVFLGCKKKAAPDDKTNAGATAVKVYLTADKTMMRLGQEAVVTASVSGGEGSMNFNWEVNSIANLLGSGNTVTFSPCCASVAGNNIIKCSVTDSKGSKGIGQVTIVVNP